jgi:hypothetical protein
MIVSVCLDLLLDVLMHAALSSQYLAITCEVRSQWIISLNQGVFAVDFFKTMVAALPTDRGKDVCDLIEWCGSIIDAISTNTSTISALRSGAEVDVGSASVIAFAKIMLGGLGHDNARNCEEVLSESTPCAVSRYPFHVCLTIVGAHAS